MGASVMLVDFRGSGGSSERYTTIGLREAEDWRLPARYALAHLHTPFAVLFGESMGAVAILKAVRERSRRTGRRDP
jgi:pimeloyl-ACP methyl ester carboxylesterase